MPIPLDLSLFERILLATDGTVTDLIALFAGERIQVQKLEQTIHEGRAPPDLQCATPSRLLTRRILLSGHARNFLYAESQFLLDRLPHPLRESMLHTDLPVGLLWKEARLETFREVLRQSIGEQTAIAQYFGVPSSTDFVSRTYLVHHAGKPLGMITEMWPMHSFDSDRSPKAS
jgi:chorismate-pyruvate lyase